MNLAPVFLLGTQRSGTTLLTRILSNHSSVYVQNELPLTQLFDDEFSLDKFYRNMDNLFEKRFGKSVKTFIKERKLEVWGLKDPQLTEYLNELESFIPESKFILIIRDARGVVNSYINNKWGLGTNAYTGAIRWNKEVNLQLEFAKKYPNNVFTLLYEDLILDMENELQRICSFLEIPFDHKMLAYHEKKADLESNKQNINTSKAPSRQITEKWKTELSKSEIDIVISTCGKTLQTLGYIESYAQLKLSPLMRFYYQLHQKVVGEIQIQYQLWKLKRKLKGKERKQNA
ncbi:MULTISPECIES: sulfotransferase [unclassified Alteromonas]|uniref:sulfotransferase family protein n=1 Tax=unclassified Alteromonas TaxID=2614992 RepID=UPI001EF2E4AC|nr:MULTISPECIES: sulfotransferase [unclassified Alteromonas]MCG7638515.1 sulfotransferase [Alteromonas sp. CNT1-28]MCG7815013.1 sulfotransferase [Alteromonas sp. MCA-1]